MKVVLILVWLIFSIVGFSQTKLLFLGDSLTAGYLLPKENAFPNQFEKQLSDHSVTVTNAGISGDTSYTLLHRLPYALTPTPNVVFLCIGANDGLRGFPIDDIKKNITRIVHILNQKNIPIIFAGMSLPDNYTKHYIESFKQMYQDIAKDHQLLFLPFLLEPVAGNRSLNLADGIHPNQEGHQKIAAFILDFLKKEAWVSSSNQWVYK